MSTENKITIAVRKADRAAGTMLNACKAVAETIMAGGWDKDDPKTEAARMLAEAKAVVQKDGYDVKNRNVWMFVSQQIAILMVGEATMLTLKDDGTTKVRKRASELKTAREIAAGAKAARAEMGMSDGRATNGANERATSKPAKTERAETIGSTAVLGVLRELMETTAGRQRVTNFFKSIGYDLKKVK